jgi:MFS family permease
VLCLAAAVVAAFLPNPPADPTLGIGHPVDARLGHVLWAHRRAFAALGTGIMALSMVRSARQVILPLWCEMLGMDASAVSLVYALSMGIDMSLFFVGGLIMDRFGRVWVAVPSMIVLGIGLNWLAFADHRGAVVTAAILLGLGNGLGAGIVMTLGSDQAPTVGRAQFLSGWRLMADVGNTAAPLLVGAIAGAATLGAASLAFGVFSWTSCAWLGHWIRRMPRAAA